jgi:hypothetical protein
MAFQSVVDHSFEAWTRITKRRMLETKRYIYRIEAAKILVCGVPSREAINKLRHDFETLLPLLKDDNRTLNNGHLDTKGDAELRELVTSMQECDAKMSDILEGSLRIGLASAESFPLLLEQFKAHQERLQSQIEGILLALY